MAGEKRDTDVQDFLDGMIKHQELSIQEMARYYTKARLVGAEPVGKYLLDWELHRTHVAKNPTVHDPEIGYKFYAWTSVYHFVECDHLSIINVLKINCLSNIFVCIVIFLLWEPLEQKLF